MDKKFNSIFSALQLLSFMRWKISYYKVSRQLEGRELFMRQTLMVVNIENNFTKNAPLLIFFAICKDFYLLTTAIVR